MQLFLCGDWSISQPAHSQELCSRHRFRINQFCTSDFSWNLSNQSWGLVPCCPAWFGSGITYSTKMWHTNSFLCILLHVKSVTACLLWRNLLPFHLISQLYGQDRVSPEQSIHNILQQTIHTCSVSNLYSNTFQIFNRLIKHEFLPIPRLLVAS